MFFDRGLLEELKSEDLVHSIHVTSGAQHSNTAPPVFGTEVCVRFKISRENISLGEELHDTAWFAGNHMDLWVGMQVSNCRQSVSLG